VGKLDLGPLLQVLLARTCLETLTLSLLSLPLQQLEIHVFGDFTLGQTQTGTLRTSLYKDPVSIQEHMVMILLPQNKILLHGTLNGLILQQSLR